MGWKTNSFNIAVPGSLIEYFNEGDANKDKAIVVFHSHPNGEIFPSLLDIKSMIITNVPLVIFKIIKENIHVCAYMYEEGVIRKIEMYAAGACKPNIPTFHHSTQL